MKFQDENFTEGQLTMKTSKITSLKNLYVYGHNMISVSDEWLTVFKYVFQAQGFCCFPV